MAIKCRKVFEGGDIAVGVGKHFVNKLRAGLVEQGFVNSLTSMLEEVFGICAKVFNNILVGHTSEILVIMVTSRIFKLQI